MDIFRRVEHLELVNTITWGFPWHSADLVGLFSRYYSIRQIRKLILNLDISPIFRTTRALILLVVPVELI